MSASSTAVPQAAPAPGPGTGASAAESSADEITPIIAHERGNGKGKRYDGSQQERQHDRGDDSGSGSGGTTRRRKQQRPPPARRKGGPLSRDDDDDNGDDDDDQHHQQQQEEDARKGGRGPAKNRREHDRKASGGTSSNGNGNGNGNGGGGFSLKHLAEKYGSIELDNKGAVARDHLALERTFLAWLRTSLAFASIGIAVTQLFRLNTTLEERDGLHPVPSRTIRLRQLGKPLGATFLGVAIVVLVMGGRRYFESQYWIVRGKFPASRGSIFLLTFIAVALIVISLVLVCVVDPSVFEK